FSQKGVPETIHALAFDARGRLLVGTELGIWRGVNHGFTYDGTSGGVGIEHFLGVATPTQPGMSFSDLNSNLQIFDTTSVAQDPYDRNVLNISSASSGWARTSGGLQWISTNGDIGEPTYAGPVRTGPFDPSAPPGTLANVYHALQYVVAFI